RHRRSLLQPKRIALICDRDKLLTYLNLHIVSSPIGIALHETFGDNQLISARYMQTILVSLAKRAVHRTIGHNDLVDTDVTGVGRCGKSGCDQRWLFYFERDRIPFSCDLNEMKAQRFVGYSG